MARRHDHLDSIIVSTALVLCIIGLDARRACAQPVAGRAARLPAAANIGLGPLNAPLPSLKAPPLTTPSGLPASPLLAAPAEAVQARDYTLKGVTPYAENMPKGELKSLAKWAQQNMHNRHLDLREPLVDDAPEYVIYNWADAADNYVNLTVGIHSRNVQNLLAKKRNINLGLYGMSDPSSAALFGHVLMEVAVYRGRYPVRASKSGPIKWKKVRPWQFSVDPTKGAGAGDLAIFHTSRFQTDSYVVQDLRVIKQLRFPNKEMIVRTWFEADLKNGGEEFTKTAEQWLLTPNYSIKEKALIAARDYPRFLEHLKRMSADSWALDLLSSKIHRNTLRMKGVFEVLFGSPIGDLVDIRTGNINYMKLKTLTASLTKTDLQRMSETARVLKTSRLKRVLELAVASRSGVKEQQRAKGNLIKTLIADAKNYRDYLAYDETKLKRELGQVNEAFPK